MSTSILLLADTHLPKRAKTLPDQVWREVDAADVVLHAGDWVDLATFEALEQRSRKLIAVWGNNDGPELRERMPETAYCELEGVRFAMTHETGASSGRERRMDRAFPDIDVLVFGHSHIPWDTVAPSGMRLLNPGSPTDRRRQPHCTYMRAVADAGALTSVELIRLPPRTV
ncbi:metallophosphoesterase [Kocuria marina]|uniref:metallophosphoesterase family protein n=1 Tax=Kocuria TaxID=57493 RepID=UPI001874FB3F|nr:metallophosphoesterase [Kocuria marina]MCT1722674.1 metallophosphoesterase [Kocuria marina]MCT1734040.1 metallophosphoesterase [Kocuria marina]GHD85577.1 phosphoesterase [Kocuria marina]